MSLRCTNCGWVNQEGFTKCDKCNSPLQSSNAAIPTDQEAPSSSSSEPFAGKTDPLGAAETRIGKRTSASAWDAHSNPSAAQNIGGSPKEGRGASPRSKATTDHLPDRKGQGSGSSIICPNCQYPNAGNDTVCVRCETPLDDPAETVIGKKDKEGLANNSKKGEHSDAKQGAERRVVKHKTASEPGANGATMNPWSKPKYARFHLLPVSREGEDLNIRLDFEGNAVDLNRANLEPTNMTITSKVQATISYRDGAWYLENGSELQTTFLRVDGVIKLEKGDIVLLGDRMFEFDC